jgi:hypothetical protein
MVKLKSVRLEGYLIYTGKRKRNTRNFGGYASRKDRPASCSTKLIRILEHIIEYVLG